MSGVLDVFSFLRLGQVFTSVMTSNIVFLGAAAVRRDGELAWHAALALAGFAVGAAAAERVRTRYARPDDPGRAVQKALLVGEAALVAAVAATWLATDQHPRGGSEIWMLAAVTVAMGSQSALSRHLGRSGVSTTYLTGMLTGVFTALGAAPGRPRVDRATVVVVAGATTGAALGAAALLWAPAVAPWIAVAGICAVIGILARDRSDPDPRADSAAP